jgi:hypothetical protein
MLLRLHLRTLFFHTLYVFTHKLPDASNIHIILFRSAAEVINYPGVPSLSIDVFLTYLKRSFWCAWNLGLSHSEARAPWQKYLDTAFITKTVTTYSPFGTKTTTGDSYLGSTHFISHLWQVKLINDNFFFSGSTGKCQNIKIIISLHLSRLIGPKLISLYQASPVNSK